MTSAAFLSQCDLDLAGGAGSGLRSLFQLLAIKLGRWIADQLKCKVRVRFGAVLAIEWERVKASSCRVTIFWSPSLEVGWWLGADRHTQNKWQL